jgi:hypothetical protein
VTTPDHRLRLQGPSFVVDLVSSLGYRVSVVPDTEHPGYVTLTFSRGGINRFQLHLPPSVRLRTVADESDDTLKAKSNLPTAELGS